MESTKLVEFNTIYVKETHYMINSEKYNNVDIWIHVVVMHNNSIESKPCVLLIRGYGGKWSMFKDFMLRLVKDGHYSVYDMCDHIFASDPQLSYQSVKKAELMGEQDLTLSLT